MKRILLVCLVELAMCLPSPSWADTADVGAQSGSGELQEIVVTARKREESIMKTPVLMSVVTAQEVQDLKIQNFQDLAQVTPGLQIAPATASVGMYVYFRGLGNGGGADFADQAVQLNIDGMGTTHGAFYRTGMFDVGQIEILEGPQALFYGRSSSAGIIAVHSADPTDTWQAKMTVGHEFNAVENDYDAFVSGPLTDKLGVRIAGYYNTIDKGWLENDDPIAQRHMPDEKDAGGRITLKYVDDDRGLRANLKFTQASTESDMWEGDVGQRVCYGAKPTNVGYPYDDCKLDTNTQSAPYLLPYNPNVNWYSPATLGNAGVFASGSSDPRFRNGHGYTYTDTVQSVLNVEYDFTPSVTLTSVTGYSQLTTQDVGAAEAALGPTFATAFWLAAGYQQHDFSEELRLTSNWKDSWFNYMVGAFYNPDTATNNTGVDFPAFTNAYLTDNIISTKDYSGFGQVLLTPIPKLEFALGARWTEVKKTMPLLSYANNAAIAYPANETGNVAPLLPGNIANHTEINTSPEATVTWRPTDTFTAFASYKQGYKAPATNVNEFTGHYVAGQVGYADGEKVKGFEGGIKTELLDRHLNLTATAYRYSYDNLQVVFSEGASYTTIVANGADARVEGAEFGAVYRVHGIEGLTLTSNANYNRSYFTSYPDAPCYAGEQFVTSNCVGAIPGSFVGTQNLSGQTLAHAPMWTGQLSSDYRAAVTPAYSLAWRLSANLSSSYNSVDQLNPLGRQGGFATMDSALRFGRIDGPWEIGFIIRDITNKIYRTAGFDDGVAFTHPGDALEYVNRPRQWLLQLTVRPALF
jgi:iron complex outermembrane receptor protein